MHRLASLGWTDADLAATTGAASQPCSRDSPATPATTPDPATIRRHRCRVRIPDYSIDPTVDHDTATGLHGLATDHGLTAHITPADPVAALISP